MGGNSPSHLPPEGGEGGGVIFVKGIRLSDSVINRMRRPPQVVQPQQNDRAETQTATAVPSPSAEHLLPLLTPPPFIPTTPAPPPQEGPSTPSLMEQASPIKLTAPPPVKFHSLPSTSVEPSAPPTPVQTNTLSPTDPAVLAPPPPPPTTPSPQVETPSPPPVVPPECFVPSQLEAENLSPSPAVEHVVEPAEVVQPPPTVKSTAAGPIIPPFPVDSPPAEALPQAEPAIPPATVEEVAPAAASPPSPTPELIFEESAPPCHCVELAVVPADAQANEPLAEPQAPPPPAEEPTLTPSLPQIVHDEAPAVASVPPPAADETVVQERLRQKIREEMQRRLEEELNQRRQQLQQQLEEVRAQARAEAKAAAQAQVEEQVKKMLEAEKMAHMENLTDSIVKERTKTKDERLLVQLDAQKLEEREKELKKREIFYKEQVAKLEAKCNELYKVTSESFQKGKEETHNRFVRFSVQPVCGDLQSQVLKCYKENTGKTLCCSRIASAYMQCVDNAKKNTLSTGG
ncbi:vegetative cell wall protein gp1-like isoform X2 [Mastacembelus armatus]|uniref:Coiled-coil-helix-coiled-coil-helix domain containing 3b n=1 Tax=Mastacembelus armatus TaxID=205130 RepID=A0A3Q3NLS7_9TELE|nr:vegetative cell wall protein gp1-like isoform X2 [Mastacembelus armatus]